MFARLPCSLTRATARRALASAAAVPLRCLAVVPSHAREVSGTAAPRQMPPGGAGGARGYQPSGLGGGAAGGGGGGGGPFIAEVDERNFEAFVLSSPVPVILDVYATWCEPCKTLTPQLESLVMSQQGRIRLAKMDADRVPRLSQQFQVRGLPTVVGIVAGKQVDRFEGVPSRERMTQFLQRLSAAGAAPEPSDDAKHIEALEKSLEAALVSIDAGGDAAARSVSMLSQLMSNPAIVEIISGPLDGVPADVQRAVARACAVAVIAALQLPTAAPGGAAGAGAIVEQCIGALGGRFKAHEKLPEVARAFAHAKLRGELSDAPEPLPDVPPTPEALFASARWALRRGDFVGGVKLLLDHVRFHKGWHDGAARKLLLAAFGVLGPNHPEALRGRKALSKLLFI